MSKSLKDVVPAGHTFVKDNIQDKGNPLGLSMGRSDWAKDLEFQKQAEYVLFAGCGYQTMKYAEGMMGTAKGMKKIGFGMNKLIGLNKGFGKLGVNLTDIGAKISSSGVEDRYSKVLISSVNVLQKLNIDIGYLGEEEPCCGSPMYYAGYTDEFSELAHKNNKFFKMKDVKKIIGLIPSCTAALKNGYAKYVEDYDLEVKHIFEVVAEKMAENPTIAKLPEPLTVTYHEPCQLSRFLEIVDEPRQIMGHIEGLEFISPQEERCKELSTCCGGGGLEAVNPELSERLGERRIQELLDTKADVIVTNCPACLMQLSTAVKKRNADVKVMDMMELLDKALSPAAE